LSMVALDGMGVLYSARDDVLELLCPYIAEKGGTPDIELIQRLYHSASLGEITSAQFWQACNINPAMEDDYLERHKINGGLIEFIQKLPSRSIPLWLLSNDLAEWSHKLRLKFGLEEYFQGIVVSGSVHLRKPDPAIYRKLLEQTGLEPQEVIFVDDRSANLDAAADLGIHTVLFDYTGTAGPGKHPVVSNFRELLELV
jgi:HAD superfamily hydrolase (TIGR01509 family)